MKNSPLLYAFQDIPDEEVKAILKVIPSRWGRMPPLSRALVVEAGRILASAGFTSESINQASCGRTIGLIGGSKYGSFSTDKAFAETMRETPQFASPALFGYTLPNIPLAEAANQYGLIGPVYGVIDSDAPFKKACMVSKRILQTDEKTDFMLACEFDDHYVNDSNRQLHVTFTLLKQHD